MEKIELHLSFQRLIASVRDILTLIPNEGAGATDSMWYRFSKDCHFLSFGEVFDPPNLPYVEISFYPIYTISSESICEITLYHYAWVWKFEKFMQGRIYRIHSPNTSLSIRRGWSAQSNNDKNAYISLFDLKMDHGSIMYSSNNPGFPLDEWSFGKTSFGWESDFPKSPIVDGRLMKRIGPYWIPPEINISQFVSFILRRGKFDKFLEQLRRSNERRKAAA